MGRGRAKAKQTKVARELKYSSPGMDLDRLSRDLHTDSPASSTPRSSRDADRGDDAGSDTGDDPYAAWADEDEDADSAAS